MSANNVRKDMELQLQLAEGAHIHVVRLVEDGDPKFRLQAVTDDLDAAKNLIETARGHRDRGEDAAALEQATLAYKKVFAALTTLRKDMTFAPKA